LRGTNGSFHVSTLATLRKLQYQQTCFILDPQKQGQISWISRDTSNHTVILKLLSNMQQKYVFCLKPKKPWITITVLYILCACIDTQQEQDTLPQSGMHDVTATSNNHQQKDRQFAMLV